MNKNQIGPENNVERYGLYLVEENGDSKEIARSEDKDELIAKMHELANNNYHFAFATRTNMQDETRTYEVRDDSWDEIFVEESCNYYEANN